MIHTSCVKFNEQLSLKLLFGFSTDIAESIEFDKHCEATRLDLMIKLIRNLLARQPSNNSSISISSEVNEVMTRLGKKIEIAFGDVKKKLEDELRIGLEKLCKEMKRLHEVRNNLKCSNKIVVYCKKNWKLTGNKQNKLGLLAQEEDTVLRWF